MCIIVQTLTPVHGLSDLVTGAVGVYGAIHQAVTGFQTLPANVPKVTIHPLSC